jgi:hypothetical protein
MEGQARCNNKQERKVKKKNAVNTNLFLLSSNTHIIYIIYNTLLYHHYRLRGVVAELRLEDLGNHPNRLVVHQAAVPDGMVILDNAVDQGGVYLISFE